MWSVHPQRTQPLPPLLLHPSPSLFCKNNLTIASWSWSPSSIKGLRGGALERGSKRRLEDFRGSDRVGELELLIVLFASLKRLRKDSKAL